LQRGCSERGAQEPRDGGPMAFRGTYLPSLAGVAESVDGIARAGRKPFEEQRTSRWCRSTRPRLPDGARRSAPSIRKHPTARGLSGNSSIRLAACQAINVTARRTALPSTVDLLSRGSQVRILPGALASEGEAMKIPANRDDQASSQAAGNGEKRRGSAPLPTFEVASWSHVARKRRSNKALASNPPEARYPVMVSSGGASHRDGLSLHSTLRSEASRLTREASFDTRTWPPASGCWSAPPTIRISRTSWCSPCWHPARWVAVASLLSPQP
jgi:hypothetical protein